MTLVLATMLAALGMAEHQCAPLTGVVFYDVNRDGYHDAEEPGLPGIQLQKAGGWSIATDDKGQFHVDCADLLTGLQPTDIIIEIDTGTLPHLYEMTTESAMSVKLEAGEIANVKFGAVLDEVHLTLWEESFVKGQSSLTAESKKDLDRIVSLLREGRSDVELFYVEPTSNATMAKRRIKYVETALAEHWHYKGCEHEITIHSWQPKRLYARPNP